MIKFIIIGNSRSGKTTVGKLLETLSLGRIKYKDTSKFNPVKMKKLPSNVKHELRNLHAIKYKGAIATQKQTRKSLQSIYDKYGLIIAREVLSSCDMYIGLRQVTVIRALKTSMPNTKFVVIKVISKLNKLNLDSAEVSKFLLATKADYTIHNDLKDMRKLIESVAGIIKDLDSIGALPSLKYSFKEAIYSLKINWLLFKSS